MAVSEIWTKSIFLTCVIIMQLYILELFLSSSRMRETVPSREALAEQA